MSPIADGSVNTTWKYGTGSSSVARATIHSCARRALALWTVPVAAAIVGDNRVGTGVVLAAHDMPTEGRRAAALDRAHHLELAEAHVTAVGVKPSGPVVAEDIRDLQGW